jgi:hypothetical protein
MRERNSIICDEAISWAIQSAAHILNAFAIIQFTGGLSNPINNRYAIIQRP